MNLITFSRPCSHFGIIFEQEKGKRGIPLYQTWHIVNSITLYHFTSHSMDGMEFHLFKKKVLAPFQCFIPISAFYPRFSVLSPIQRFILISVFYPHFSVLSPFQR